ncbi:MAG TPA: hypothetical protein PLZ62_01245 [bacterium]|nr:hypothetical protein [bacterium]
MKFFAKALLSILICGLFPVVGTNAAADYSYRWISQSGYVDLFPEQTARLWVLVENTGTKTWDKNVPIHLGTSNPVDRDSIFYHSSDWLSPNRPAWLTDDTIIQPGDRAVFMFEITAPATPGTYQEYFRPVVENAGWLEDYGIYWQINVKSVESTAGVPQDPNQDYSTDGIYRSELVYQESPQFSITQGETKKLAIQIKNTGTATWHNTGDNPVHLGTGDPWDRHSIFTNSNWVSTNRPAAINENNVNPSDLASYNLVITAPTDAAPGIYVEKFESVAENISWFMDYNITYIITVKSTNPQYGELITDDDVDQFLSSGDTIDITDLQSGKSMTVQTIGMDHYHADVAPIDATGTDLIREIYNFHDEFIPWCDGDDWILWQPNAVTVRVSSDPQNRQIAAAMVGCPHDTDGGITNNNFPGHFCLHFLNSMQHGQETPDCSFQKMVQKAAGNPNYSTYGQTEPCWNPCVTGDC